jgi:hypothetical protein
VTGEPPVGLAGALVAAPPLTGDISGALEEVLAGAESAGALLPVLEGAKPGEPTGELPAGLAGALVAAPPLTRELVEVLAGAESTGALLPVLDGAKPGELRGELPGLAEGVVLAGLVVAAVEGEATSEEFGVAAGAVAGGALASPAGATVGPEAFVGPPAADGEAGTLAATGTALLAPPPEHSLQSGPGIAYEQYPMSV